MKAEAVQWYSHPGTEFRKWSVYCELKCHSRHRFSGPKKIFYRKAFGLFLLLSYVHFPLCNQSYYIQNGYLMVKLFNHFHH